MVSDDEIVSAVLAAIARVQRGEASTALAGEQLLAGLMVLGAMRKAVEPA